MSRNVPEDETWSSVAKGGPNGIYIVLIGLAWWYARSDTPQDQKELASVVEDVLWTMTTMLEGLKADGPIAKVMQQRVAGGTKRGNTGDVPAAKKRCVWRISC